MVFGHGRGPCQLSRDESRRMNLNDDVVYRCLRLGPLHQLHPGCSRSPIRHNDCLHENLSSVICLFGRNVERMESPLDIRCKGRWVVLKATTASSRVETL